MAARCAILVALATVGSAWRAPSPRRVVRQRAATDEVRLRAATDEVVGDAVALPDDELCDVLAGDPKFRAQREGLGCLVVEGGLRDTGNPRGRLVQECEEADMGRDLKRRGVVLSHVEALEASNPTPEPLASPDLNARWRLIYTTSDSILGTNRMRLFRPRPRILQHVNAATLAAYNEEWVLGGLLRNSVKAKLEPRGDGRTVDVQFKRFGIGWLKIPAPKSARGVLETTYLDPELRISRGDKGNIFVLVRDGTSKV